VASRFYLQSTSSAPFTPAAADGGWERDATGHAARLTSTGKANSALTTLSSTFGATQTSQTRWGTWVSQPLDVAQTISGTVSLVVGKCAETTTSGDAHLAFAVRVVTGAGVHRATLATSMATATEFPLIANAATRIHSGVAISSFAADAGDRIVIELGIHGVTPANETMQMRFGDPTGTADFALTSALTTDLVPWVELSQNITFGAAATAASEGVSTTSITGAAKRLLSALAIGGIATCAVTASKIEGSVLSTASAAGQSTASASVGRLRGATTSASGTSTTTLAGGALRTATISTSGTGVTTVTLTAYRGASSSASGIGTASVTGAAIRATNVTASGTGAASATASRLTAGSTATAAGSGSATATIGGLRGASASAAGSGAASVTLTAITAESSERTATASGTGTASVTAAALRSTSVLAAGSGSASATLTALTTTADTVVDVVDATPSVDVETLAASVATTDSTPTVAIGDATPAVTVEDVTPSVTVRDVTPT
jgi:hypothetical protein